MNWQQKLAINVDIFIINRKKHPTTAVLLRIILTPSFILYI